MLHTFTDLMKGWDIRRLHLRPFPTSRSDSTYSGTEPRTTKMQSAVCIEDCTSMVQLHCIQSPTPVPLFSRLTYPLVGTGRLLINECREQVCYIVVGQNQILHRTLKIAPQSLNRICCVMQFKYLCVTIVHCMCCYFSAHCSGACSYIIHTVLKAGFTTKGCAGVFLRQLHHG